MVSCANFGAFTIYATLKPLLECTEELMPCNINTSYFAQSPEIPGLPHRQVENGRSFEQTLSSWRYIHSFGAHTLALP